MDNIDWENPNLLIGGGTAAELTICSGIETASTRILEAEIQQEITESHQSWDIRFDLPCGYERYIVFWLKNGGIKILRSHSRNFYLSMEHNPAQWRFIVMPTSGSFPTLPASEFNDWGEEEFTRELGFLPPDCETGRGEEARVQLNGHYLGLLLWLRFRQMKDSPGKDLLREMLYTSPLNVLLPCANLSVARREFAYDIYPWVPLAQRAQGEEHLWFFLEYSACLQKLRGLDASKTKYRAQTTEGVRAYREALKELPPEEEFLTIESLQQEGIDWRLCIQDLLIQSAIKECWESSDDTSTLRQGCARFLTRLSQYNGVVGHKKPYVMPETEKQPRARGRPIGSRNVKNCEIIPDFGNKQKAPF